MRLLEKFKSAFLLAKIRVEGIAQGVLVNCRYTRGLGVCACDSGARVGAYASRYWTSVGDD